MSKTKKWRPKPCRLCGLCIYRNGEPCFISWRSIICYACLDKIEERRLKRRKLRAKMRAKIHKQKF